MHRVHDAAAREECAEDRERERRDHERQVPCAQEAALLLDHDRMEVRGRDEPRHDRRVLDRVPGPIAAPAQHRVRPPRARDDADAEQGPGHEREAPRRHQPAIAALAEDERRDRVGERDREQDVPEIKEWRVQGHEGMVLQQRVGAVAVEWHDLAPHEWIGGGRRDE